jgi:hypothetical protein
VHQPKQGPVLARRGLRRSIAELSRTLRAGVRTFASSSAPDTASDRAGRDPVTEPVRYACVAAACAGKMAPFVLLDGIRSSHEEVGSV